MKFQMGGTVGGECVPRAGDGEGALDGVVATGHTVKTDADAAGNQVDGDRSRCTHASVTAAHRCALPAIPHAPALASGRPLQVHKFDGGECYLVRHPGLPPSLIVA